MIDNAVVQAKAESAKALAAANAMSYLMVPGQKAAYGLHQPAMFFDGGHGMTARHGGAAGVRSLPSEILANVGYSLRYRSYLPLYSLRAACGVLGEGRDVAPEGWIKAEGIGKLDDTMVVVRAVGDSMEPTIHDGDLCVVRKIGAVDYDNRIVLVQRNDKAADPETGGAYLLKKFVKTGGKALLRSLNGDYSDIEIACSDDIKIVAEFKTVLRA